MTKRLAILLVLTSCISTEVIGYEPEQIDTVAIQRRKPHKPLPPMPPADTTKQPIGWNPSVEDWEATNSNL